MSKLTKLIAVAVSGCLLCSTDTFAQTDESFVMDEIIVTGRKREETLTDIPVSTSVFGSAMIEDAGIDDLNDLFTLVPGLHYDEEGDRLAALPSIRGVQSNEISSNRTKVTAFVDGIPVLGSQGSIGFNSFQQVEVYRGPQSAAFGRSTFAGAINYITKDPTEELEGTIDIDVSDYGERVISGSFSGQIVPDVLGFIIQAEHEDSSSPDEFHADADISGITPGTNFGASDGTERNSREGDNISAKFVFTPTDSLSFDLAYSHVETKDQANATFYLSNEARLDCFEGVGVAYTGEGTAMGGIFNTGVYDCDWDSLTPAFAQHNHVDYLDANPLLREQIIQRAEDAGAGDFVIDGETLSVEEQVNLVALGYSVPEDDIGTTSERDRVTLQTDFVFGNNHGVQLSLMASEEEQLRMTANSQLYYDPDNVFIFEDGADDWNMAPGVGIIWEPGEANEITGEPGRWEWTNGMGAAMTIAASPTEIEEKYAELRYVSPGEYRVRGVFGASYYDYEYLEENYANSGMNAVGLGFGARGFGIVDEFTALVGLPFEPDESILSENATNTALFGNLAFDATDWMTLSAELRYQVDDISGEGINLDDEGDPLTASIETKSLLPRLAVNFNLSDDKSMYVQWSKGVNPAGVNIGILDPEIQASINAGIPDGLIPYPAVVEDLDEDGELDIWDGNGYPTLVGTGQLWETDLRPEDLETYDEEELDNYEIGFKGSLFDGKLQYAGAVYHIDWSNQIQTADFSWDSPCADNQFAGVFDANAQPICEFQNQQYLFIGEDDSADASNVALNFGNIEIQGIELETTYNVNNNVIIRGSAAYSEAEYKDYCDIELGELGIRSDPAIAETLGVVVGEPNADVTSICYVADGNEVADQPKLTWSLSPQFRRDVFNGLRFSARADIRYEGRQWIESGNYGQYPSVMTGNLSFGLSGDRWAVTAYVENFTDEDSPTRISTGGDNSDSIDGFGVPETAFPLDVNGNVPETSNNQNAIGIGRSNYLITPRRPRTLGFRASYDF